MPAQLRRLVGRPFLPIKAFSPIYNKEYLVRIKLRGVSDPYTGTNSTNLFSTVGVLSGIFLSFFQDCK